MSDQHEWQIRADQVEMLALISRYAARADPAEPLALRLCRAAAEVVGAGGVAITVATGRLERFTLCTTDDVSARLEDLQEVLGEGPSLDAYRSAEPQTLDLRGDDPRWPRLLDTALDTVGAAVLHAYPIHPGPQVLGVTTFYLSDAARGPALQVDPMTVQGLVNAVGVALIAEDADVATGSGTGGPWATRAKIHQATGMVIAQLGVSAADALALLRAHAFAQSRTLAETAGAVVNRRLTFVPDAPARDAPAPDAPAPDAPAPDAPAPDPGNGPRAEGPS